RGSLLVHPRQVQAGELARGLALEILATGGTRGVEGCAPELLRGSDPSLVPGDQAAGVEGAEATHVIIRGQDRQGLLRQLGRCLDVSPARQRRRGPPAQCATPARSIRLTRRVGG